MHITIPSSLPAAVIQRNGQSAVFDAARIRSALQRAGTASGEYGADEAARKTNAATLKIGATYDLFVDTDGTQKVKVTAAGTQLVGIRDLGAGWVLVEISSAAKAM